MPSTPNSVEPGNPPPSAPPPRGPALGTIIVFLLACAFMLGVGATWGDQIKAGLTRVIHPNTEPAQTQAKEGWWTCGMHPWIVLPKKGLCPVCHMELVPLDASKFTAEIAINPIITQNIGVRIAPVVTGPVNRVIRTVGTVDYDETLVRDVNLKVSGWVDKLYVNYTGKSVTKGQPLFDLYSPDLIAAQEEYLQAYRGATATTRPGAPGAADQDKFNAALLDSARRRLENLDIDDAQIKALEKAGKSSRSMTINSPYSGQVIVRNVNEGQKLDAGTQVYRLADLSKVWVLATLYEYQIPFVKLGQPAVVTLPYLRNVQFDGTVNYIYPYINTELRQAKLRVELGNPDGLLKPGMYGSVELHATLATDCVLVPREAVVDTGQRQVAFVSLGNGRFEPRDVKLGVEADNGMVVVDAGLKQGDLVVISGEFLLDSERRLREDLAKLVKGTPAAEQKTAAAPAGAAELAAVPAGLDKALAAMVNDYFAIGDKLVHDTLEGAPETAGALAADIDALLKIPVPADEKFWARHEEAGTIRGKALEIAQTKDLAQARQLFGDLSTATANLLRATGVPAAYGKEVEELHCPVYQAGQGGTYWLQPAGEVRNPYMGQKMLGCFDTRTSLPMARGATTAPTATPAAQLSATDQRQLDALTKAYLEIHKALAADKTDGVAEQLTAIRAAAEALAKGDTPAKAPTQKVAAAANIKADKIDAIREAFKTLSLAVVELVKAAPATDTLYQFHCPMVKADWLQDTNTTQNPYDMTMPGCGSVVATFKGAGK
jgi:RND family efflux transporter MFP subunit